MGLDEYRQHRKNRTTPTPEERAPRPCRGWENEAAMDSGTVGRDRDATPHAFRGIEFPEGAKRAVP